MWMMLLQDRPDDAAAGSSDDFLVATGETHSVQ